jgi:trehalose synthase
MIRRIDDYVDVVGAKAISTIFRKVHKLYKKRICNVNATFLGGGVAEILGRLVPLMNDVGLIAEWRTIHGSPAFFDVTKKFHNALQGGSINLSQHKKTLYLDINQEFARFTAMQYDCVIVHDPQPLPLIQFYKKLQPWIWRCHIDLSEPNKELWSFLERYMLRYDIIIVSSDKYKKNDLPVEQRVIPPAIDPLSLKNMELSQRDILKYMKKAGVPIDKPIIAQVSRMDPWKDPEGVLEVYDIVRRNIDCRLLYCYNLATDDPQGMEIYTKIRKKAQRLVEKGDVIFVVGNNDVLVNAVQRFATVIMQKSTREGFALTVTEALWKAKPVVAGNVGGIPQQIQDGQTGFLVDPHNYRECADKVISILKNPKLAQDMGRKAKEYVRQNFLTTRLLSDYLDLIADLLK